MLLAFILAIGLFCSSRFNSDSDSIPASAAAQACELCLRNWKITRLCVTRQILQVKGCWVRDSIFVFWWCSTHKVRIFWINTFQREGRVFKFGPESPAELLDLPLPANFPFVPLNPLIWWAAKTNNTIKMCTCHCKRPADGQKHTHAVQ